MRKEILEGWGRNPRLDAALAEPSSLPSLQKLLREQSGWTCRGLGRSYGDASLGKRVLLTCKLDRLLSFNEKDGIIECEAGFSLSEILRLFVPRGWFPPVTPGTRFVTVGGMLASDIHGKNHHKSGSFSNHVLGFSLLTADAQIRWVDRKTDLDLFLATAGGMGLTGVLLSVRFQMLPIRTAWIRQETRKIRSLSELIEQFEETSGYTYSVAWIDCLAGKRKVGRSLLMLGEHAEAEELSASQKNPLYLDLKTKMSLPVDFPRFFLNSMSLRAFNTFYFQRIRKKRSLTIVPLLPFFYPLDAVHHWNRIYGKRGFFQYQCVLPKVPDGAAALREMLLAIARAGEGSFLSVLKLFGPEDAPFLSFAREGYTLALDFPVRSGTAVLLERLDDITRQAGGRLYLTKDARMSREFFQSSYPQLKQFLKVKGRVDPENCFTSLQAERLGLLA